MTRDDALTVLRGLRQPLRMRGVAGAALFGSIARDRATPASDVDVIIRPEDGRTLDLFDLGGVQSLLDDAFGRDVDLIVEPVRKARLRDAIARDRVDAF